jgi:4-hydroxy-3-polyprenylbenzoate decarboxylase
MFMAFKDLRAFISFLEKNGDLIRISKPVSTNLEITEIHRRVLESSGPALLFENVHNEFGKTDYPVLVNLFGTVERVAQGISLTSNSLHELGEKLAFLRQPAPPESLKEAFGMLPLVKDAINMKPKLTKKAPCQEIVMTGKEIDLNKLPIQTCWPNEPAPLITWPMVVTKDCASEKYNVGIYRMQKLSKDKTIMRWLDHRGGADHWRSWKNAGHEKMPVAAVLGCDPGTTIAAVTPVPEQLSEYEFAGLIRKSKLELVKCKTIPLLVPANAEMVIEGYVSTQEFANEGPYGDHTGYYNSVEKFPIFEITAITTRKDAIYLSTYTGRPPDEPSVLGEALNKVFVPLLKQQIPEVVDFYLPPEGCSYRIGIVSIKKSYPGHARKVMMGVWSVLRQFMYTKFLIIVNDDIDVRSWDDVMWAVSTKMDFARDVTIIENTPIDYLDFASPEEGLGSKICFDATDKIGNETKREWGNKIEMPKEIVKAVSEKFKDIL